MVRSTNRCIFIIVTMYYTFTDVYEEIHEAYFSHPVMEREIGDGTNGPSARKHLIPATIKYVHVLAY